MPIPYSDIAPHVADGITDPADIHAAIIADPPARWFRELTSIKALRWIGFAGRLVRLKRAADNEQLPDDLRGACMATLIVFERKDAALDLTPGSDDREALDGCVAASVFTAGEVADLVASCRLVDDPTVDEIADCIRLHDATQRITAAYEAAIVSRDNGDDVATVKAAMLAGWEGV